MEHEQSPLSKSPARVRENTVAGNRSFLWKISSRIQAYFFRLFRGLIPIQKDTVLFFTFQGAYTCNPKYICQELLRQPDPPRCIWVAFDDASSGQFPPGVEVVRFETPAYFRALYGSKVWVDNAFNITKQPVAKKKGQYYVDTMHGSLGIKRLGPEANPSPRVNRKMFRCGELTDYIISNSDFETMVYRTSYWKTCPVLLLGHARNDILVNLGQGAADESVLRKKVRDFYGLPENCRLAMYAPTFLREENPTYEVLDLFRLKTALETRFGGEWIILSRLHPRDARKSDHLELPGFVRNGNLYTDIQELMAAINLGITDYSSWIYDYVLTGKPGMIYAPDLAQYQNSTGFYYPITATPFPLAANNSELEDRILNFNEASYLAAVKAFLADKGCIDDGHGAEKAAKLIMGLLNGKLPDQDA